MFIATGQREPTTGPRPSKTCRRAPQASASGPLGFLLPERFAAVLSDEDRASDAASELQGLVSLVHLEADRRREQRRAVGLQRLGGSHLDLAGRVRMGMDRVREPIDEAAVVVHPVVGLNFS